MVHPSAWSRNYGTVSRLMPSTNSIAFTLKGGRTAMNPKNGYYILRANHQNYNALVALLYMAANVGYTIYTRTKTNLDSGGYAEVIYLRVDW